MRKSDLGLAASLLELPSPRNLFSKGLVLHQLTFQPDNLRVTWTYWRQCLLPLT